MWGTISRAGIAMVVLAFMMQVLVWILNPILDIATSGPNADAESVVVIGNWFGYLSVSNLTLLAGLGIAVFVVGRAAVERRGVP